ncbi:flavodoxin-dependent (E)-4-hydroxy-3-methylbut-2-enyl-diphosphate synthase [Entomospira entomophila]|uniref:4-hydroxy-3-methylbut-2-en-1-yl diphosphate synthase (flavodoxin) n=1 Tax=Entomospira entomophila TaxID=2719988 RepID=A0A968KQL0_9SPIO|nr:flavodoxin-dependent (E)-4-hydroxy-3-methylbut-2-enyl-diphosphate synthase [Entomospira entomophilus]NIZ39914.1 flavodoxin-dependent (E)-4-hydroxy-3-methylbut-2-enyl-diphosphate synthase [Entomospira entomophilus]WDI35476.1 flavodoxin-dependent (E)-4-hydroxy-3-methylbut-2-enyl-diphosphate synthase [Entomospira entomophilus]
MLQARRAARTIHIGNIAIGGDNPIAIQTMWDRPINTIDEQLVNRINNLKTIGCDAIRFGSPRISDVELLGELAPKLELPLIVDIHFDYKIALRALDYPIAKLRINPGNIGMEWKVAEVARKAKDKGIPIRIGVNGGSLLASLKAEKDRARALVKSALDEVELLEKVGFEDIVISVKDSNPEHVDEAVRLLADECDYPIHLGITEAGTLIPAITQSAFFLGGLLRDGLGDTIRISISDRIEYEVMAARQLLSLLKIDDRRMPKLISCPLCARNTFDTHSFAQKIEQRLYSMQGDFSVAVMGCVVNGPGEASAADLAITGAGKKVFVYRKHERIFEGDAQSAEIFFLRELENLEKQ